MKNKIKKRFVIFFSSFLVISGFLFSQATEIKPVLIRDNLYLISGLGGNIVFMVAEEGVLVIDSGSMSGHSKLIAQAIGNITSKPIKYLVLTHYHYDHVGGSLGFSPDVRIISHCLLEKNLTENSGPLISKLALPQFSGYLQVLENQVKKYERESSAELEAARGRLEFIRNLYQELKNFKPFRPDICFEKKMVIHLSGDTVELIYPGHGHTDDGCLVYFPGKKVLHTGDLFVHRVCPFFDELAGSDINSWIHILQDIIDHWDVNILVPGHGEPCSKEGMKQMLDLLIELREAVAKAVQKGLTLEQTLEQIDLPSFRNLPALDLLKYDIEAVYKALKK